MREARCDGDERDEGAGEILEGGEEGWMDLAWYWRCCRVGVVGMGFFFPKSSGFQDWRRSARLVLLFRGELFVHAHVGTCSDGVLLLIRDVVSDLPDPDGSEQCDDLTQSDLADYITS